jgi:GSH-dependent disulfide-bond oxidoreductase
LPKEGVLDRRLGEVELAGGDILIADFAILGWAWRHERHQIDLAHFTSVRRWYETLMAHPGVQRGFAVALS